MTAGRPRVILVDRVQATREVLAARLRAQGYDVEALADSAKGAELALGEPPSAVVADLWTPGISGVQLCRLLRSEAATSEVSVILRGEKDDPKSRFWAERAGAAAYVVKGRMGDLVRALDKAKGAAAQGDGFFMQLGGGAVDVRDRIAQHLDAALFDSVIASEVRALGSAGTFDRLFDQLSQLMSQLGAYHWLALSTVTGDHFGVHHHPRLGATATAEARRSLELPEALAPFQVEDEDALASPEPGTVVRQPVAFGKLELGRIALCVPADGLAEAERLVSEVARELGGPLRMTALIEESQRQASIDPLTGSMNRRAFLQAFGSELSRSHRHDHPLSVLLLDVDHFKRVNDEHGHAAGDQVLVAVGALLRSTLRISDISARWGGEEFVVALPDTGADGALTVAERLRAELAALELDCGRGKPPTVTVSIGVATLARGEGVQMLLDRADRAMYAAKVGGRNRVVGDSAGHEEADAALPLEAQQNRTHVH